MVLGHEKLLFCHLNGQGIGDTQPVEIGSILKNIGVVHSDCNALYCSESIPTVVSHVVSMVQYSLPSRTLVN